MPTKEKKTTTERPPRKTKSSAGGGKKKLSAFNKFMQRDSSRLRPTGRRPKTRQPPRDFHRVYGRLWIASSHAHLVQAPRHVCLNFSPPLDLCHRTRLFSHHVSML
ncbi:hypothetical protein EDC04DRAFT_48114 [Pisolithus marmoratus]|nr:hypothetical protein EDC04DRAFT_48114 [Pisolithus marmoratus]